MKKIKLLFEDFFWLFVNKLFFFMKVKNYLYFITIILLFVSCKNKNVYSEENKALILFRCNIINFSILKQGDMSDKFLIENGITKKIDCLCYLDKIQKEFTDEEYMQINMDFTGSDIEKRKKMLSLLKDCQEK
jgi:hypothetical protein